LSIGVQWFNVGFIQIKEFSVFVIFLELIPRIVRPLHIAGNIYLDDKLMYCIIDVLLIVHIWFY